MLLVDGGALGRMVCVHSEGLSTWLDARPWSEGRDSERVFSLRLPGGDAGRRCIEAIRRAALAIDERMTDLRVVEVPALRAGQLVEDLAEAITSLRNGSSSRDVLACSLEWPPHLLLCGGEMRCTADDVDGFTRLVRALVGAQHAQVAAVVFEPDDSSALPDLDRVALLSTELPCDETLDWSWYWRHRVVWEADARLAASLALTPREAVEGLPDDTALEQWLEAAAARRVEALSPTERARIEALVRGAPEVRDALPSELGSAWGGCAPWVVRACRRTDPQRWRALVCRPLAAALFDACVRLEGFVRQRRNPKNSPDSDTIRLMESYRAGNGSEANHYTANTSLRPSDPWDFASLGHWLSSMSLDRKQSEALHELRVLRNHLAHGHHVSWATVLQLRRIQRALRVCVER